MNAELVTKDFLKETLSHEFEKFSTILVTEFGRIDNRFGRVEEGLSSLNFRLERVENNLFELTEMLEAEMTFTSDLRDNLDKRVDVLERKRS